MKSPRKLANIMNTLFGVLETWSIKDWNMSFKDGKMEIYFTKEADG